MSNGRVDINKNADASLYALFERGNGKSQFAREAIINVHPTTQLNDLYFSDKNIRILQLGIRNMIANLSQGEFQIGDQSEVELQVIMRAMYLSNAKHLQYDIIGQVRELNKQVIDYCVPRIMEEIRMFKYYKKDVSQLPMPMARGEFSSSKGMKVLESREF
jgi:hypothetical protein